MITDDDTGPITAAASIREVSESLISGMRNLGPSSSEVVELGVVHVGSILVFISKLTGRPLATLIWLSSIMVACLTELGCRPIRLPGKIIKKLLDQIALHMHLYCNIE